MTQKSTEEKSKMYYGFISRIDTLEETISEIENISVEIAKDRKYRK